jgi:hypothetical protein
MSTPIATLNLGSRLEKKLAPIDTIEGLRAVSSIALMRDWKLTSLDMSSINAALIDSDLPMLTVTVPKPRKEREKRICGVDLDAARDISLPQNPCQLPRAKGKQKCVWHWLLAQPIAEQVEYADQRGARMRAKEGHVERSRVPEKDWPAGRRWCSECQAMIPLFYCIGSKCRAHASRAAHASMTKRVYDLTNEDYQDLLAWQGGKCYICGKTPRTKRLAVDHDHVTELVRGLLCANDEFGCNFTLRILLNNYSMALRALEYVEMSPIDRMRSGQPPVVYEGHRRPPRPGEAREDPKEG